MKRGQNLGLTIGVFRLRARVFHMVFCSRDQKPPPSNEHAPAAFFPNMSVGVLKFWVSRIDVLRIVPGNMCARC